MHRFIAVASAAGSPDAAEPPTERLEDAQEPASAAPNAAAAQALARNHIARFAAPQDGRGASLVALTVIFWFSAFVCGHFLFKALPLNTWWGLALGAAWVVVRVGTHVRCFCVMHDAVHYSLFTRRWLNEAAATISGMLIMVRDRASCRSGSLQLPANDWLLHPKRAGRRQRLQRHPRPAPRKPGHRGELQQPGCQQRRAPPDHARLPAARAP